MVQFQVGKTYATSSICDSNSVFSITVVSRTAKTIKTECGKTLRCFEYEGFEQVRPMGKYSMCPVIGADDMVLTEEQKEAKANAEYLEDKKNDSLAELMKEGESLFTPDQFEEIKNLIRTCVRGGVQEAQQEAKPVQTAKIYNFADFRKKA